MQMASLEKRILGRTGAELTALGFGAWPIGGIKCGVVTESDAIETIETYLAAGGNHIDTARGYGNSELYLGKVLCGGWREKVFLATKTHGGGSRETLPQIRRDLEESLRLLQTDYVDLYYLHNPPDDKDAMNRTLDEFESLKNEGKIKAIGASVKGPDVTPKTVDLCKQYIDSERVDVLEVVYSILRQLNAEMFDYAEENGVGIVARTTIESGFLSGKYPPGHMFGDADSVDHRNRWPVETRDRIFRMVHDMQAFAVRPPYENMAQVAVKFALAPAAITSVIIGAKNADQMRRNMALESLPPLDTDIVERLKREYGDKTLSCNTDPSKDPRWS